MFLVTSKTSCDEQVHHGWRLHNIRQAGRVLNPNEIGVGQYYVYKEKFGMVAIVKVLKDISENGWTGFRLKVKRVLYSPWSVQQGTILEAGFYAEFGSPTAWHLEACVSLVSTATAAQVTPSLGKE